MGAIRRILVGLGDREYSASATACGIELALAHNAKLTGIALLDPEYLGAQSSVPIGAGHFAKELRESRIEASRDLIDQVSVQFAVACRKQNIEYDLRNESGDPFERVAEAAKYHDLTICGLQSFFAHGIVEEPPHELVHLIESGVRPLIAVSDTYESVKRVLIAYSGSMESARTMKRFVQLRLWPGAKIQIAHFGADAERAANLLENAATYCNDHGIEVDTVHGFNLAYRELLPHVDAWQADLIVMGNSARRLLRRRLLGRTMLHVVEHGDRHLFLDQ